MLFLWLPVIPQGVSVVVVAREISQPGVTFQSITALKINIDLDLAANTKPNVALTTRVRGFAVVPDDPSARVESGDLRGYRSQCPLLGYKSGVEPFVHKSNVFTCTVTQDECDESFVITWPVVAFIVGRDQVSH